MLRPELDGDEDSSDSGSGDGYEEEGVVDALGEGVEVPEDVEETDVGEEGTADQDWGATAWNFSLEVVPFVQPLLPQQCQSCSV